MDYNTDKVDEVVLALNIQKSRDFFEKLFGK